MIFKWKYNFKQSNTAIDTDVYSANIRQHSASLQYKIALRVMPQEVAYYWYNDLQNSST